MAGAIIRNFASIQQDPWAPLQGGQGGCGGHGFVSLYLVFLRLRWFGLVEFGLVWLSLVWFGQVCFGLVIPQTNKQIK